MYLIALNRFNRSVLKEHKAIGRWVLKKKYMQDYMFKASTLVRLYNQMST